MCRNGIYCYDVHNDMEREKDVVSFVCKCELIALFVEQTTTSEWISIMLGRREHLGVKHFYNRLGQPNIDFWIQRYSKDYFHYFDQMHRVFAVMDTALGSYLQNTCQYMIPKRREKLIRGVLIPEKVITAISVIDKITIAAAEHQYLTSDLVVLKKAPMLNSKYGIMDVSTDDFSGSGSYEETLRNDELPLYVGFSDGDEEQMDTPGRRIVTYDTSLHVYHERARSQYADYDQSGIQIRAHEHAPESRRNRFRRATSDDEIGQTCRPCYNRNEELNIAEQHQGHNRSAQEGRADFSGYRSEFDYMDPRSRRSRLGDYFYK